MFAYSYVKVNRNMDTEQKPLTSAFSEMRAKGGQLVFAFLAFKKEGGEYAYIFFRQSHQKAKGVAAVVYMEGKMTPNEVKRKFLTR